MEIQMVDLKGQYEHIRTEIRAAIQEVIDSAAFIKGSKVNDFQNHLEQHLGVKHVIPVASGTDALQIALMSLGLQSGDEVIIPTFTFIATAEVVALLGLTIVPVDVELGTFCMSANSIENAITPKTKAIIPVHLFGQNANMEAIVAIAKKHGLYIIEDACQSIGANYTFSSGETVKSGCIGNLGCTSFFPSKNLGCFGDGGAIFTNNDILADEVRCIANHGMRIRYHHDRIGVNSRLDSIQAAVLDVKLTHFGEYTQKRQWAATCYDSAFSSFQNYITIPQRNPQSTHVFHQYTIRLNECIDRDLLREKLTKKGVPTMVYYPIPLHLQNAYKNNRHKEGDFPIAEGLCKTVLSLPMHTELSQEQLDYITTLVVSLLKECKK